MALLLTPESIVDRRRVAAGGLAPLADSLTADIERALVAHIEVPRAKALLSRAGGVCERDGTPLTFDPWSPHDHRCPRCGQIHRGDLHDRWWLYPYQLWLAERTVHAAALYALRGDERHAVFAADILRQYADAYLTYPNRDNVLGPTRPFFSTYLESIWLLQLCVALDLLEAAEYHDVSGVVREQIIEPSVTLIASYNEGASNRQVWNNAALLAGHAMLGHDHALEPMVYGPSGLLAHLEDGLLDDGTWFEGENYHQFAHRGLWYGVELATRTGLEIPAGDLARFDLGYRATFATALPDMTLPARKDSQYATSLRQWRFAELCEVGLARNNDPMLAGMLQRLYASDAPTGDTGRASASAEAERNHPPVRLSRADLGWKSLLFACEHLPEAGPVALESVLLPAQGVAVFRRDAGQTYVALDYGQSGGGHGHPDRLNLLLATGATRWLDDLGTASYVDPSLHWYRSTLAHNAPLVDGHSQWRVDGTLDAYDEQPDAGAGWVRARAFIWPDVVAERTIVVMDGYAVDLLRWRAGHGATVTLPVHCDAQLSGQIKSTRAHYAGAGGLEDGDQFVSTEQAYKATAGARVQLTATDDTKTRIIRAFIYCQPPSTWYALSGPGQPPTTPRRFIAIEAAHASLGTICSVWAWSPEVERVEWSGDAITATMRDGARHRHGPDGTGWHVSIDAPDGHRQIALAGPTPSAEATVSTGGANPEEAASDSTDDDLPYATSEELAPGYNSLLLLSSKLPSLWWTDAPPEERARYAVYHLGAPTYRRSEDTWEDAGRPLARIAIAAHAKLLTLDLQVITPSPRFTPANAENPYDNEPADVNGDGVQFYVRGMEDGGAWMLVPDPAGKTGVVRVRPIEGWGSLKLARTTWRRTREGYELRVEVALRPPLEVGSEIALDVLVNQTGPDRERRRGQLVLSGPDGEFIYLRGDRHDPSRLLHFTIVI